tara:strand:- start:650 stop:751 length:102 start_codon:yes stop_codon:yes gene_type:complete
MHGLVGFIAMGGWTAWARARRLTLRFPLNEGGA